MTKISVGTKAHVGLMQEFTMTLSRYLLAEDIAGALKSIENIVVCCDVIKERLKQHVETTEE